ncbi:hypothetical protein [Arthrobacter sp. H41]|uniref:hypothetical protein n=1 Tax=Arthrobacter sp. H41 TaxID=1312978 RepID=UPI00047C7AC8|nr:hypothetical protein [Arthrobacter sp. H41]
MEPQLFHLEGPSLEVLRAQVAAQHGPHALIISAERVMVGGISGFFARHHYEIVVEVPRAAPLSASADISGSPSFVPGQRIRGRRSAVPPAPTGIGALLDLADEAEESLSGRPPSRITGRASEDAARPAAVSTDTGLFAALMDDLTFTTGRPASGGRIPSFPELLTGPGDLVVVAGDPRDVLSVTRSMAGTVGGTPVARAVAGSGAVPADGISRVETRLDAGSFRASGVDGGHPVFVAFGLGNAVDNADALLALCPDQVWCVVDAGRKPPDTARWVGELRRGLERHGSALSGIAVVGALTTATPETVYDLGVPVGWVDGHPSAKAGPADATQRAG